MYQFRHSVLLNITMRLKQVSTLVNRPIYLVGEIMSVYTERGESGSFSMFQTGLL